GVHRPGTGLIYFPAEGYFVYALDVDRAGPDGARLPPVLAGVLETKHPPRSLRGEPVLLPPEVTGTGAAHLILSQFEGNDSVRLRAFALPEPGAGGGELTPAAEAELPGWNWFTPYHDTEKLAVATDRGAFGLFGIAQPGNADPVLFPMLPGPFRFRPDSPEPSRGLVAHAGEDRFWVLARGALHRLEFGLTTVEGLKLVESGTPLPLGAPLHAGQVNARGDTVLVVTQAEGSPACLATAFDPRSGRVRWQRQLGVLALGDPVRAGEEWVLAGRSGELYRFGPEPTLTRPDAAWQSDPRRLVAPPVKGVAGEPALVPAADGRSVYSVVPLRRGERHSVLLRHYRPGEGGAAGEYPVDLPAAPAGRPIELGGYLLLPLEDGTIHRLAVPGGRMPEAGPTWRETARLGTPVCHLARLSGEEFLATDGDRTLTRRRWPAGGDFALVGQVTLPARIDRPPLVLPGGPGQPDRVVVADRSGTVSLFAANKLDRPLRTWKPGDGGIPEGRVTRGPFPLGGSVGYVAGGRYLVRLDLSGDRPRWVHDAGGGGGANA
ncbi:MAG TPA: hypothetical protein VIL46_02500, partial [Gemmataceae bacterium]